MNSNRRPKIPALTGMRTIAAGLVFFYHWFFSYAAEWPLWARAPFEAGYVGVPIFFALSGFLITMRYQAALATGEISYGRYLYRRFMRIFPLYFFVLTLFVVAFGRPESMMPQGMGQYVATYTMAQAFFPDWLLIGTAVGWTLTIEMIFYLLAPLLLRWLVPARDTLRLAGRAIGLSLVAVLLGLAVARLPWAAQLPNTLFGAPDTYIMHYTIFGHLVDFLVGMVCGLLYLRAGERLANGGEEKAEAHDQRSVPAWRTAALIWLSLLGSYLAIIGLATVATELGSPLNRLLGAVVALGSSTFILGTAFDQSAQHLPTRLLAWRPLVYMGVISYALYLIQLTEPIQWLYWVWLGERLGVDGRIGRAILLYVLATIIAGVWYQLVEQPIHRRWGRWRRQRQ